MTRRGAIKPLGLTVLTLTVLLTGCSSGGTTPAPTASSSTSSPSSVATPRILVGARSRDVSFAQMNQQIGPIHATRLFYDRLPAKFAPGDVPADVKMVVSYRTPSPNTAAYIKSIPANYTVEMAFHHEPEGPQDFPGSPAVVGPKFVQSFDTEAKVIRAANPKMRVAFIGGGFQYRPGGPGIGGYFIPTTADDYYFDSYQQTRIVPAAKDKKLRNFIAELTKKHLAFNGFSEYGRGAIPAGGAPNTTDEAARIKVIPLDAAWLESQPTVNLWIYWYTPAQQSGDQWRFTDPASQKAWKTEALTVR